MNNLQTLPREKQLAILRKVAAQSGKEAENLLVSIAETKGDTEAIALLSYLGPVTIGKIIRDHDFTIPSVAYWLAEPEVITRALSIEPANWLRLIQEEKVDDVLSNLFQIVYAVIMTQDDEDRRVAILEELGTDENCFFSLLLALQGACPEDKDELFGTIENATPALAERIESFWTHQEQGDESLSEKDIFLVSLLKELAEAAEAQKVAAETHEVNEAPVRISLADLA